MSALTQYGKFRTLQTVPKHMRIVINETNNGTESAVHDEKS